MLEKKRNYTEIILDVLQDGAEEGVDLLKTMLTTRSESYKRARTSLYHGRLPEPFKNRWSEIYARGLRLRNLISKLKHDGLIERHDQGGRVLWKITARGKERNARQKSRAANFSLTNQPKKSDRAIIVSYDIPENLRRERLWLREVLTLLEFNTVHKSVLVGGAKLSRGFLKELSLRGIIDYVEIFEVTKSGTLEKIK